MATGSAISFLSSDAAGNIYFLDGGGNGNLKMHARGNGTTVYTVTGTSGITVSRPSVGWNGTLFYEDGASNLIQLKAIASPRFRIGTLRFVSAGSKFVTSPAC